MAIRGSWLLTAAVAVAISCKPAGKSPVAAAAGQGSAGQLATDSAGPPSIARIAAGSQDHTTLVAALQAVNWLDALANPGPFTVFAPVDAAFDKLPPGTVETLLKPENNAQLKTILLHHVMVSAYDEAALTGGLSLAMLDGGPTTVKRQGNEITVDGAKILGAVRAGNGWVYVVDAVILPKAGK